MSVFNLGIRKLSDSTLRDFNHSRMILTTPVPFHTYHVPLDPCHHAAIPQKTKDMQNALWKRLKKSEGGENSDAGAKREGRYTLDM